MGRDKQQRPWACHRSQRREVYRAAPGPHPVRSPAPRSPPLLSPTLCSLASAFTPQDFAHLEFPSGSGARSPGPSNPPGGGDWDSSYPSGECGLSTCRSVLWGWRSSLLPGLCFCPAMQGAWGTVMAEGPAAAKRSPTREQAALRALPALYQPKDTCAGTRVSLAGGSPPCLLDKESVCKNSRS